MVSFLRKKWSVKWIREYLYARTHAKVYPSPFCFCFVFLFIDEPTDRSTTWNIVIFFYFSFAKQRKNRTNSWYRFFPLVDGGDGDVETTIETFDWFRVVISSALLRVVILPFTRIEPVGFFHFALPNKNETKWASKDISIWSSYAYVRVVT